MGIFLLLFLAFVLGPLGGAIDEGIRAARARRQATRLPPAQGVAPIFVDAPQRRGILALSVNARRPAEPGVFDDVDEPGEIDLAAGDEPCWVCGRLLRDGRHDH